MSNKTNGKDDVNDAPVGAIFGFILGVFILLILGIVIALYIASRIGAL